MFIPANPALQHFDRVKIVQTKFFQDIQDESEHFRENISQTRTSSELAIDGIRYEALESWKPTEDIAKGNIQAIYATAKS